MSEARLSGGQIMLGEIVVGTLSDDLSPAARRRLARILALGNNRHKATGMASLQQRFEAKMTPEPMSGCWLWFGAQNKHGYGRMIAYRGKWLYAHRAAWILYRGDLSDDICLLHKCDNPSCCNPGHLFLGDRADNAADRVKKGRHKGFRDIGGEKHPQAKLTESSVLDIRKMITAGETTASIARAFDVGWSTIHNIKVGLTWQEKSPGGVQSAESPKHLREKEDEAA